MLNRGLTLAFCLVASARAHGEGPNWYKPFLTNSPLKNESMVAVFGRFNPGVSVSVDESQIVQVEGEQNASPSAGDRRKKKSISTVSDSAGFAKLVLSLPLGLVQVPFSVIEGDQPPEVLILTLKVSKTDVKLSAPTSEDTPTIAQWRQELKTFVENPRVQGPQIRKVLKGVLTRVAFGSNYQIQNESLGNNQSIKFGRFNAPSLGAKATWYRPYGLIDFQYNYMRGGMGTVKAPLTLAQRSYDRHIFTLEGGRGAWRKAFDGKARFDWLYGIQYHSEPFFYLYNQSEVRILSVKMAFASAGASFTSLVRGKNFFEMYLRTQYPVHTSSPEGTDFSINPQVIFDGSLGFLFPLKKKYYAGLFWYGQWMQYRFNFNESSGTAANGTHFMFNSNLDLSIARLF